MAKEGAEKIARFAIEAMEVVENTTKRNGILVQIRGEKSIFRRFLYC
jgi:hypothetical protein